MKGLTFLVKMVYNFLRGNGLELRAYNACLATARLFC